MNLRIFQTVVEILEYCWLKRRLIIIYGSIPFILGTCLQLTINTLFAGTDKTTFENLINNSPAFALFSILTIIIYLPITVTWYRIVVMGEEGTQNRKAFHFSTLEVKVLIWQIIIFSIILFVTLSGLAIIIFIEPFFSALDKIGLGLSRLIISSLLIITIISIFCRISLVLPMVATNRNPHLKEAWIRSKGLGMRMAAIYLLCSLSGIIITFPLQILSISISKIFTSISSSIAELIYLILNSIISSFTSLLVIILPITLIGFVYNIIADSQKKKSSIQNNINTDTAYRDIISLNTDETETALKNIKNIIGEKIPNSLLEQRKIFDKIGSNFSIPKNILVEKTNIEGLQAYWFTLKSSETDKVLLWIHGGGFCMGSFLSHRKLAADLAQSSNVKVLLIEYKLAPEHPFPAGLNDCISAYKWLLNNNFKPGNIIIGGDSAGGGLAVSTSISLKEHKIPQPAALITISPWVNLECNGETMEMKKDEDPIVKQKDLKFLAKSYLGDDDDISPLSSPIYADLRGLPPILIQVGTREILLDDSRKLAVKAKADEVEVEIQEWREMIHVWHLFSDWLGDGKKAIDHLGAFVRDQTGN